MLPTLFVQIISIAADVVIFIFVWHYILELRKKKKELDQKETTADTSYHQIVDTGLTKERKILEDATNEADQIISDAQYITQESKTSVDQALKKMAVTIQGEAADTAQGFTSSYQASLKQLSGQSLNEFQEVAQQLEADLQKQIKELHNTLLPNLEKEVEDYKQARLQHVEQITTRIIQKVSQEVFNKSLSVEDHRNLLIESLEKAKKEGIFS